MGRPKRERRPTKTARKRASKAARKLPPHMQDIAFSLAANRKKIKGTFGPASPVRIIDPKDYEAKDG